MTITNITDSVTTVLTALWSMFGSIVTTITSNMLLAVPVYIALMGGLALFAISIAKRLGLRGVSSSGRRRYRRRR